MRSPVVLILVVCSCMRCGCASSEHRDDSDARSLDIAHSCRTTSVDDEVSAVDVLLFPLNVGPNIVANTLLLAFNPVVSTVKGDPVSNIWPIVTLSSPLLGPVGGVLDAAAGYPFWDPVALEESRRYPWTKENSHECSEEERQAVERANVQLHTKL